MPDGGDLRVGEHDPRRMSALAADALIATEDHVGRHARLVLRHVREQRDAVCVTDGVQPGMTGDAELIVDLDEAPVFLSELLETQPGRARPPSDGNEQLVTRDDAAVLERHPNLRRVSLDVGSAHPEVERHARLLESVANERAREGLLA